MGCGAAQKHHLDWEREHNQPFGQNAYQADRQADGASHDRPGAQAPPPRPPPRVRGLGPMTVAGRVHAPAVKRSTPVVVAPAKGPARERAYLVGAQPQADMAALNTALLALVASLQPGAEEVARQQVAFEAVRRVLSQGWPQAQVHLFGSTANGLSICNNNDIDICLELPDGSDSLSSKGEVVEQMAKLVEEAGMKDVLPLPKARVPVVKFVVGETGTKVDVTVNNILAIVNTKLLRDYGAIDQRLLQLCFVVKHWAKRRQVNDSYRGTLSSYCYVLMCIHLLQQRAPPILPCLHALKPSTHRRTVGVWQCDYHDEVSSLEDFGAQNTETLAELVWAFFEYWAWKHDYNNSVISVRTASFLTKAQKEWTRRVGNERHLVCIEDPFELTHDLGRTVDRQTSGVLHKEFERAACILRDCADPLEKLFEPYRAGS
ncbi:hypothetical protein WJX72_009015 [[Myrmecia] bisecta]|uniref:Polynucleotide adenylyltransferase n=1 Tax=[Myrmecia] bisecta TaxID=41462 RepID=A0AAW1PB15_9CHLO